MLDLPMKGVVVDNGEGVVMNVDDICFVVVVRSGVEEKVSKGLKL